MQFDRKVLMAVLVLVVALVGATPIAKTQEKQSRLAHSDGTGTLKIGNEAFKISSVVVKLIDDRALELTLISNITVFLSGTWSSASESQHEFDLEITGGATPGGLQATGKLLLNKDGRSVVRLTFKGVNRTTKRPIAAEFQGK